MKQITEQQIAQIQNTLHALNVMIDSISGISNTSNMLQNLPDIEEECTQK